MQSHLAFANFAGKRIHLGVCGSIAAYKSLELLRMFLKTNASCAATLTGSAERFVTPLAFEALGAAPVYTRMYGGEHDTFGHLEPAQDADVLLYCPATANSIAKLACGLADDMLSTQALAFEGQIIVAPAMNPRLWSAAATRENVDRLRKRGVIVMEPGAGSMACGEEGQGRLPELFEMYCEALRAATRKDLQGRKVLVTLGPTREKWDSVRFWTNPSTGTMGAAVALAAWLRGADVTAVCGPVKLDLPSGIKRINVTSADDMFDATTSEWPNVDMACLTAAVADFKPIPYEDGKFKKAGSNELTVSFSSTRDILKTLGSTKHDGQVLIGFAAESHNLEENARKKLTSKNLDFIMGNQIGKPGSGFAGATNTMILLDAKGGSESWPELPKTEVAWRIWDHVSAR